MAIHPEIRGNVIAEYYRSEQAKRDVLDFVRPRLGNEFRGDRAICGLVHYYDALMRAIETEPEQPSGRVVVGPVAGGDVPVRARGHLLMELDIDIEEAIQSLRLMKPVSESEGTIRKFYRTVRSEEEDRTLLEISALAGQALLLCDGTRTVEEFAEEAGGLFDCPDDLREYAAERLLVHLRKNGLIEVYREVCV